MSGTVSAADFEKALAVGRPPNIQKLFPNSKALIVSGKVVDRALRAKGQAMTIAANGRNNLVIRGVLRAAQRANATLLIEIAKSEGGRTAYTATNYWNMARQVDAAANELGITVPIAIHADHYGIKGDADVEAAKTEIPTLFESGVTSIAIDAVTDFGDFPSQVTVPSTSPKRPVTHEIVLWRTLKPTSVWEPSIA